MKHLQNQPECRGEREPDHHGLRVLWKKKQENLEMEKTLLSLKELKQDPQTQVGHHLHQPLRRRRNMKPLVMQCTGTGAPSAWLQRAMDNNTDEYLIRGSCSTQWSWTIGT